MSNRPRSSRIPERRPPTRRQIATQQRESNLQRLVLLTLGGVILLALLLIIGGLVWEQVVQPRQTIKQVNGETLTRARYDRFARESVIQQMVQSLRLAKLFGPGQGFGADGSFDEQVLQANLQLAEIGTPRDQRQPPNDALVDQWVEHQLTEQGAKEEFEIDPQPSEVDQRLVAELGGLLETPAALTDTATLTGTATPTGTETRAGTVENTTPTAPATPTVTALPTKTPQPAEATQQAGQIIDTLYEEYLNILNAVPAQAPAVQRTPHMTKDELAEALRRSYREQLIQTRVQEALVPELPDEKTEPTHIRARHILLRVPEPSPSPKPTDDAETPEATPKATEEGTPEPTSEPTPTPKERDQLFAKRKAEADALYKQLIADPESFEEVARKRSEDPGSAQQGGNVGTFDRQGNVEGQSGQTLAPEFVDTAWALEDDEISKPVRTEFGWHIIQRLPEDPETRLQRLRQEAFEKWLAEQRQEAAIVPAPTLTPTLEAPTPSATEKPAKSPKPEAP
jgi:hypothetical protein